MMLRSILSMFSILLLTHYSTYAEEVPNTLSDTYNLKNSFSVKEYIEDLDPIPVKGKDNRIIYVSGSLDDDFTVQLDFDDDRKSCVVPLNLTYNSIEGRRATSLGNGKIVVYTLNRHRSHNSPWSGLKKVERKISIIEPKDCTYQNFNLFKTQLTLSDIIPYHDKFDIILLNDATGKSQVRRITDEGKALKFVVPIPERSRKILPVKEYDNLQGYYYIARQEEVSLIKKLNYTYGLNKSYELEHGKSLTFDKNAYSVDQEKFSVCYFYNENRENLNCLVLDSELNKTLINVSIPYKHEVQHVTVKNMKKDGIMIIYGKKSESPADENDSYPKITYALFVQQVNAMGQVTEPVELGQVPRIISELYNFEFDNGSYGVVVTMEDTIMTKYIEPLKVE